MKYVNKSLALVVAVAFLLTGCDAIKNANNTQKGGAIGAGGGAVIGGVIGNNVGDGNNTALGAIIGGVVGGAVLYCMFSFLSIQSWSGN